MEITEPRRLYQQLAADLKERIEQGVYLVGDKLPAERFIADEKNVSRTVVREAIIMLEVEGYVEVRKGSGIHVVSNQPRHQQAERPLFRPEAVNQRRLQRQQRQQRRDERQHLRRRENRAAELAEANQVRDGEVHHDEGVERGEVNQVAGQGRDGLPRHHQQRQAANRHIQRQQ